MITRGTVREGLEAGRSCESEKWLLEAERGAQESVWGALPALALGCSWFPLSLCFLPGNVDGRLLEGCCLPVRHLILPGQ